MPARGSDRRSYAYHERGTVYGDVRRPDSVERERRHAACGEYQRCPVRRSSVLRQRRDDDLRYPRCAVYRDRLLGRVPAPECRRRRPHVAIDRSRLVGKPRVRRPERTLPADRRPRVQLFAGDESAVHRRFRKHDLASQFDVDGRAVRRRRRILESDPCDSGHRRVRSRDRPDRHAGDARQRGVYLGAGRGRDLDAGRVLAADHLTARRQGQPVGDVAAPQRQLRDAELHRERRRSHRGLRRRLGSRPSLGSCVAEFRHNRRVRPGDQAPRRSPRSPRAATGSRGLRPRPTTRFSTIRPSIPTIRQRAGESTPSKTFAA